MDGWRKARELGGIENPDDLAGQGEVHFFSGDYGGAATTLCRLVEATSGEGGGPERKSVVLRVAMLYQHALDQHGQAAALIFRLAENGGVPLFSNADLLFLLARAYEDWSRTLAERRGSAEKKAEAEKHAATAQRTFEKLYTANLQVGAFKRRAGGAPQDANAWLHDAATWRALADKCAFAGLDLYAADLYEEGARRDADGAGRAHWYRLAKAKRRCGKHDAALGALRAAIVRAPESTQLRAVETAWSNAEANDDDEHAVTIDAFLARLPPVGNDMAMREGVVGLLERWAEKNVDDESLLYELSQALEIKDVLACESTAELASALNLESWPDDLRERLLRAWCEWRGQAYSESASRRRGHQRVAPAPPTISESASWRRGHQRVAPAPPTITRDGGTGKTDMTPGAACKKLQPWCPLLHHTFCDEDCSLRTVCTNRHEEGCFCRCTTLLLLIVAFPVALCHDLLNIFCSIFWSSCGYVCFCECLPERITGGTLREMNNWITEDIPSRRPNLLKKSDLKVIKAYHSISKSKRLCSNCGFNCGTSLIDNGKRENQEALCQAVAAQVAEMVPGHSIDSRARARAEYFTESIRERREKATRQREPYIQPSQNQSGGAKDLARTITFPLAFLST